MSKAFMRVGPYEVNREEFKSVAEAWRSKSEHDRNFHVKADGIADAMAEINSVAGDVNTGPQYGGVVAPDYSKVIGPKGRRLRVADVLGRDTTSSNLVRLISEDEDTTTDGTNLAAEGATPPEALGQLRPDDYKLHNIINKRTVSEDLLMDVASAAPYLIRRLGYLVGRREELFIVNGDGTGGNVGLIEARNGVEEHTEDDLGARDLFTGIIDLLLDVQDVSGTDPTFVLLAPSTAKTYVLEQVGRAEDSFTQQILENVRIVVTSAMPEDKVVVGSPEAATLFRHSMGLEVRTSNGYGTYFGTGLVLARGKVRSAVTFERPSGIGVLHLGS